MAPQYISLYGERWEILDRLVVEIKRKRWKLSGRCSDLNPGLWGGSLEC